MKINHNFVKILLSKPWLTAIYSHVCMCLYVHTNTQIKDLSYNFQENKRQSKTSLQFQGMSSGELRLSVSHQKYLNGQLELQRESYWCLMSINDMNTNLSNQENRKIVFQCNFYLLCVSVFSCVTITRDIRLGGSIQEL